MYMVRIERVLIVVAIGFTLCAPARVEAARKDRAFFWELRSPTVTAYILGSVHLMRKDAYPLRAAIEDAFQRADTLVVEVDDNGDAGALLRLMTERSGSDGRDRLKTVLRPETYKLAGETLRQYGLDITGLESLRPWMLATMLTVLETEKYGLSPEYGVDKFFLRRARESGKRIISLESLEYQFRLMNDLPMPEQDALLLSTLEELGDLGSQVNRIMAAWKSGDESEIEALTLDGIKEQPFGDDLYHKIISERNVHMASRIDELLSTEGTVFVVVGAAHLVGEDGIISLLSRMGRAVDRR